MTHAQITMHKESAVLRPELFRNFEPAPKSAEVYMMRHIGLRPSQRSASQPLQRAGPSTPSARSGSGGSSTSSTGSSFRSAGRQSLTSLASAVEPAPLKDPYVRAAKIG